MIPNNSNTHKRSQIVASSTEVNYPRKVTLKDADIDTNTRRQKGAMYKDYDDIFSKHVRDIGKTDLGGVPPYIYGHSDGLRVKTFCLALIALGLQGHWEEVDSVV